MENQLETVNLDVIHPESDQLVVSYSTITSAIHLAAYGAIVEHLEPALAALAEALAEKAAAFDAAPEKWW